MRFYRMSGRRLWGDYGSMLIGGMSGHLPRRDGLIQLERTGPFVPPMTFPGIGVVVVNDQENATEWIDFQEATPSV